MVGIGLKWWSYTTEGRGLILCLWLSESFIRNSLCFTDLQDIKLDDGFPHTAYMVLPVPGIFQALSPFYVLLVDFSSLLDRSGILPSPSEASVSCFVCSISISKSPIISENFLFKWIFPFSSLARPCYKLFCLLPDSFLTPFFWLLLFFLMSLTSLTSSQWAL